MVSGSLMCQITGILMQKTSIVYFSNIAGNSEPFRKILRILSEEGISNPAEVFQLHELTR